MGTEGAILNPHAGVDVRFTLARHDPCTALAPYVEHYWIVRWNLAAPFEQQTLPSPVVNVVAGVHQPGIWGPMQRRFTANIDGTGWVIGATFHPGGFHPWLGRDLAEIANTTLPLATLFDDAVGGDTDGELVASMETMLLARPPAADSQIELARHAVDLARTDPHLSRCDDLAARVDLSPRSLERLFRRYIGLSPKWVVRRFRVIEACARAESGDPPSWSQLAHELGYFDQSHLIRDFKEQVGRTPAEYAAECAAACSSSALPTSATRK